MPIFDASIDHIIKYQHKLDFFQISLKKLAQLTNWFCKLHFEMCFFNSVLSKLSYSGKFSVISLKVSCWSRKVVWVECCINNFLFNDWQSSCNTNNIFTKLFLFAINSVLSKLFYSGKFSVLTLKVSCHGKFSVLTLKVSCHGKLPGIISLKVSCWSSKVVWVEC